MSCLGTLTHEGISSNVYIYKASVTIYFSFKKDKVVSCRIRSEGGSILINLFLFTYVGPRCDERLSLKIVLAFAC